MRKRWLQSYARWVTRHPRGIAIGAFLISALALTISLLFLQTQTGILDLYSEDEPIAQRFMEYVNKFGAAETLIVVFEDSTETKRQQAMEDLANLLKQHPQNLISDIFYKVDLNLFKKHSFQFLQTEEAKALLKEVKSKQGGIRVFFEAQDFNDYLNFLNQQIAKGLKGNVAITDSKAEPSANAQDLAQGLMPVFLLKDFLAGADLKPETALNRLQQNTKQKETVDDLGYLRTEDGKMHIMLLTPSDIKQDHRIASQMVEVVRQEIAQIKKDHPEVKIGVTGGPALNKDQFEISERDMSRASIFAFISTGVIFILAFRSFGRPALGLLTLALSLTWSFGFTTLTVGHLNMFSLAFVVILVGQGTYYGVHVVSRYEEELLKGESVPSAIENTITHIFGNITVSALTTVAAFYSTMLVPLKGFAELGWIAGSGILLSALGMQLVLPAFLMLYDRKGPRGNITQRAHGKPYFLGASRIKAHWIAAVKILITKRAPFVIAAVFSIALWGGYRFFNAESAIPFDSNLLNLQAKGTEAVAYEKKLIETSLSPRAGIFLTSNAQEAQKLAQAAEKLPSVQRVEWLGSVLPQAKPEYQTQQDLKIAIQGLAQQKLVPPQLNALEKNLNTLKQNLEKISELAISYSQGTQVLEVTENAMSAIQEIKGKLNFSGREDLDAKQFLAENYLAPQLAEFQNLLFPPIRQMFTEAATTKDLEMKDIPSEMLNRFLAQDGTHAIYAYPSINIWEQEPLNQFVTELQSVSAVVTGPPLMFYEILKLVRTSYFKAAAFSALAILIIFFLDFRSIRYTTLAFLPLVLGVFSLFGLMSLFDLSFNTANMIALPMILGIGADNGVHIIHRFREEKGKSINFLFSSTGKALFITYLDTFTSFIGLALANHQGLAQLGGVVILGLTCCTVAGILVLPAIMSLIIKYQARKQSVTA